MKLNSPNQLMFRTYLVVLLVSILSSCGTTPTITITPPTPTPVPPQPTNAEPATDTSSMFKAGLSYSDASGDMEVSFLDVVNFQATVNEETEMLEVLLHMRDIPPTASLGQVKNLVEYVWSIYVYLDPPTVSPADIPGDFYFTLNTDIISPSIGSVTPIPGDPSNVPINELFEHKNVYRSSGANVAELDVTADPNLDTLLLRGRVPGISSNAGFSFAMSYYDGTQDRPDNIIPNDMPVFNTGLSYNDASGDMEISFLDVTKFQAAVNEELEIVEIVLHMRDVPLTATRRQMRNVAEYMWRIPIFLDPSTNNPANSQADYYLLLWTLATDPPTGQADEVLTPRPGEPETVPIDQLWDDKFINNKQGDYISGVEVVADPDLDTITLKAPIPGITASSAFSFSTSSYGVETDRPDDAIASETVNLPTPLPFANQPSGSSETPIAIDETTQLIPAGTVHAYPGPKHYAGDVLTFEIHNDGVFGDGTLDVEMTLDDNPPTNVSATTSFINILLPQALDTTNLSGPHKVNLTTADGLLNESYSFEVLPADQRPENEIGAEWMVNEIDCCKLHYITQTAAARDIEFIAEHFQQAGEDFETITGANIDQKLDVYIMDRIWGNGGFGGNGEVVISYTDRYYGPTMGGSGLETLARHEFSHAAGIGAEPGGDGVLFNYEGLAVYVAGGHYKPEPLAERGAALFDLGHYVSVTQFIPQHELSYLYSATMLTYIVETYGIDKMWEFLAADDNTEDDQPGSLEGALQTTFGVSVQEFDESFQAWLESKDPGEQLQDLRLTVELQDLRREYQDTYSPPAYFLLARAEDAVARPEYVPVVMREANNAPNIAIELIIAQGQQAILDGDYLRAEELIEVLRDVVTTGKFEDPLAKEYLDIVLAAASAGYEVVSVEIQGDQAIAQATAAPPELISIELQKVNGTWQVQP
ncbi:MAG TPA: hypothetical protein VFQ23_24890 [Anaerolineales bacterium]|nr:hypothetical protein [Anaerolineales bacterium]